MTTSRPRSITRGLPARRPASTKRSAWRNAWRSEPQIPHARVRTSTSPGPGSGTGTSATRSCLFRMTTARMARASPSRPRGGGVQARDRGGEVGWDRVVGEPNAPDGAPLGVVDVALVIGPAVHVDAHRVLAERDGIAHGVDVSGPVHVAGPALDSGTDRLE